jgi:hypothetical protein
MASVVTLVYTFNVTGPTTAAALAVLVGAANTPFDAGILAFTQATIISDVTAVVGGKVVRTIKLNVASAFFQSNFAGGTTFTFWVNGAPVTLPSETAPFFGLMTATLRAAANQPPIESLPAAA